MESAFVLANKREQLEISEQIEKLYAGDDNTPEQREQLSDLASDLAELVLELAHWERCFR